MNVTETEIEPFSQIQRNEELAKNLQAVCSAWQRNTGVLHSKRVPTKLKGMLQKIMIQSGMETVVVARGQAQKVGVTGH